MNILAELVAEFVLDYPNGPITCRIERVEDGCIVSTLKPDGTWFRMTNPDDRRSRFVAKVIEKAFLAMHDRWQPVYSDEQIEKMTGVRAYHILRSEEFAEVSRAALQAKSDAFEASYLKSVKNDATELNELNELWTNGLAGKK